MSKKDSFLSTYAYLDSQRLKDSFFSDSKKNPKAKEKKFLKTPIIVATSIIGLTVAIFGIFLISMYDFVLIPRNRISLKNNEISLMHDTSFAAFSTITENSIIKQTGSTLHLSLKPQEKTKFRIQFNKPTNLRNFNLYLYVKNIDIPCDVGIIIRDDRFFSNSRSPLEVTINEKPVNGYIKIPLIQENQSMQNVNPSRTQQLIVYLLPQQERIENTVILKDILLAKKEARQ